jgi:YebC/PmpR family DNA-binding regulatory protein
MSGHSKWSSIKHKKAVKDARRGKLFTKLIREITVAARMGGGDINANPRLRTAVLTARANSMPNDNIERAVKKGTGEIEGVTYEDVTYEGYGPGGVAILVQVLTDNRNRTVAEIRRVFARHGGNLGENGCVAWMFQKKGVITVGKGGVGEERLMEIALEAGADDLADTGDAFEVLTSPERFADVKEALEREGVPTQSAEVSMVPQSTVDVAGRDADANLKLLEALDDADDVQSVAANVQISQDDLERLGAAG